MDKEQEIKRFDGTDEIIFSGIFNVYENKLIINNILGFNFTFDFETTEPKEGQKDIDIKGENKNVTLIFSRKFRNTLGSGTTKKMPLVKFDNNKLLLFSIYGSTVGSDSSALNVALTFYLRWIWTMKKKS